MLTWAVAWLIRNSIRDALNTKDAKIEVTNGGTLITTAIIGDVAISVFAALAAAAFAS